MSDDYTIVTFSHLRWDFVYQRPQHLLSRLAAEQRVLFIEEPIHEPDAEPRWELSRPASNVLVCRLHTPVAAGGFHDEHLPIMVTMVEKLLADEGVSSYVAWLYTPLALPLAQAIAPAPKAVVYDCMDELSAFWHAPPELLLRETALLQWADLVFTGGPSLYRAKLGRHPSVHCFSSSVDAAHFHQSHDPTNEAVDQRDMPHPRLGFYGVIDERLDLPLLDAMATAHPEWQIVMVGPVVKIDQAALPRHQNLHYLGQRRYEELPSYLAGWDVCTLPFARNESTRFISPTKILEYMVAERPIVSTPITDVAEPYGEIVYLGDTNEAFISACEQALASDKAERSVRVEKMRDVLSHTSWDRTAEEMERLIRETLAAKNVAA